MKHVYLIWLMLWFSILRFDMVDNLIQCVVPSCVVISVIYIWIVLFCLFMWNVSWKRIKSQSNLQHGNLDTINLWVLPDFLYDLVWGRWASSGYFLLFATAQIILTLREVGVAIRLQLYVQSIPKSLGAKLKLLMNDESPLAFHLEWSTNSEHVGWSL